jgi:hypothetical protein
MVVRSLGLARINPNSQGNLIRLVDHDRIELIFSPTAFASPDEIQRIG